MLINSFAKNVTHPAVLTESSQFLVKLVENREEVEKAQRLRYRVFNLEQGRGLQTSQKYGIDFDDFDEQCLHLLAIQKSSGDVIGTYRAHMGSVANSAKGFYASQEYEINGLYRIADQCLELGRTCVAREHRQGSVVAMLWKGITEILVRAHLTYMLGCVSLETTDPVIGWGVHRHITSKYSAGTDFTVVPRPGFRLEKPPEKEIEKFLADKNNLRKNIPPLFKGYLRLGAVICGEPALDTDFGSIDFFILVDVHNVPDRYKRHFNYRNNGG